MTRTAAPSGAMLADHDQRTSVKPASTSRVPCDPAALGPSSTTLHLEREAAAELAALGEEPKVIALHPPALRHYQAIVEDLAKALAVDAEHNNGTACAELRSLIEAVTVYPGERRGGEYRPEISGKINGLLSADIGGAGGGAQSLPALAATIFTITIAA
jgi:hypothetical protein